MRPGELELAAWAHVFSCMYREHTRAVFVLLLGGEGEKAVLEHVLKAALAVEQNATVDEIDDPIMAKFATPATNSLAARTDAAMKIASIDSSFASSDEFYNMLGFDEAVSSKLINDKRRSEARQFIMQQAGEGTENA